MRFLTSVSNVSFFVLTGLIPGLLIAGPYDAPAGFYNSATGTGSTLESQLYNIMSTGHIQRNYGNFRDMAVITDADPNQSGNIILVYDGDSVDGDWDSGSTWNREHVWPQSRQPGSASNGSTGNLGDAHALRPSTPSVNSNRGNDPFGFAATTGSYGSIGSSFFPGDDDKGDIARSLFYSDSRWGPDLGISLVNGSPGSNQMGDLASLIAWHYLDVPDDFERRRNHAVYSSSLNPSYYTNNRNAYVDRPEFVWSVFVDQQNDSRIGLSGTTVGSNGASTLDVDLGSVYVGGTAPSNQNVTLNKTGNDGTYYEVSASGSATSTIEGRYNAFRSSGTDSETFSVGLSTSTATPGLKSGQITIDNLDVTTSGGTGRGANDADDTINLSFDVFSHPEASFDDTNLMTTKTIDFGTISEGTGTQSLPFSLFNFDGLGSPIYASDLELDSISGFGSTSILTTNASTFTGLNQGSDLDFLAMLDTSSTGSFFASYQFNLSGEDLPGDQSQSLTLNLIGEVEAAGLAGDYNGDNVVDAADFTVWRDTLGSTSVLDADGDGSGTIDAGDYSVWTSNFGNSIPAAAAAVPEPSSIMLLSISLLALRSKQRS